MKFVNSNYAVSIVMQSLLVGILPGALVPHLHEVFRSYMSDDHPCNSTNTNLFKSSASNETLYLMSYMEMSVFHLGETIGACVHVAVSRQCSRKQIITMLNVVNVLATVLMSPVTYYGHVFSAFVFGRLMFGITTGLFRCVIMLVIAETVSRSTYVAYLALIPMTSTLGKLWLHFTQNSLVFGEWCIWPAVALLPGLLSFTFIFTLPFSPAAVAWLIVKENMGRRMTYPSDSSTDSVQQAERPSFTQFKKLRCCDDDDAKKAEFMEKLNDIADEFEFTNASARQIFAHRPYRMQMIASWMASVGSYSAYIPALWFSPLHIFDLYDVDYKSDDLWLPDIVNFALILLLLVPTTITAHQIGIRKCCITGIIISLIMNILAMIDSPVIFNNREFNIFAVLITRTGYCLTLLGLYIIPSEIATEVARTWTVFVSVAAYALHDTVGDFVSAYVFQKLGRWAFSPLVAQAAFVGFYLIFYLPEMRNKSVKEIQKGFIGEATVRPSEQELRTRSRLILDSDFLDLGLGRVDS